MESKVCRGWSTWGLVGLVACGTPDDAPPDAPAGEPLPSDLGLRALTRDELDHAVQDLLGVAWAPSELLPPTVADGYATDVAASSIDDYLVERMLVVAAAGGAALTDARPRHAVRVEAESLGEVWDLELESAGREPGVWVGTFEPRVVEVPFEAAVGGPWRLAVGVSVFIDDFLDRALLGDPLEVGLRLDGRPLDPLVLREQGTGVRAFEREVELDVGRHVLELALPVAQGQFPILDGVEARPVARGPSLLDEGRGCAPLVGGARARCLVETLAPVVRRAWRRPLDAGREALLLRVAEEAIALGLPLEEQVAALVEAVLASPDFWLVVEGGRGRRVGDTYVLSPHEVATRLALLLWASVPDDALLDCAEAGGLAAEDDGPCGLGTQVDRLLADARASRLVDGFARSWLGVARLDGLAFDRTARPELTDELVASMREETRLVLDEVLFGEHALDALVRADFTWVDRALADHYGLAVAAGADHVRVSTDPAVRGGALRTGAVLLGTAHPSRTSDVRRGATLLSALGCAPPDPPPPSVPAFDEEAGVAGLLADTSAPGCATCHGSLNPWGLALSAYDMSGRHRPEGYVDVSDYGYPQSFDSFDALAAHLRHEDLATRCFTDHFTSWAVGRALASLPDATLDPIEDATLRGGATFRAAVHAVVRSDAFLTRPAGAP